MGPRFTAWVVLAAFAAPQLIAQSDVDLFFAKVRGASPAQRIDTASQAFLGVPYEDFPTGEGKADAYDQAPLHRFDAFDCTTFVETVLALAQSRKADEFERRLIRIRYKSDRPSFVARNHFPCVDWISHNTQTGLLTDVTETLGARWGILYATAPVDKKTWFEKLEPSVIRVPGISEAKKLALIAQLRSEGKRFQPAMPSVPYVPLDKILTRTEITDEEKARRKLEEEDLSKKTREELSAQATLTPEDLDKKVHDQVIDLRLRYLIKDTQVDAEFLAVIPSGAILNVVRPGWQIPGTKMNISHQGFVIQKKEGTYFRHVSRSGGRAKDVPLANYLRLCLLLPPVKGVNLLVLQEPLAKSKTKRETKKESKSR